MNVPGPDGRYGFGGPCFPKDVSALIEFSKEIGYELSLLKKANIINNSETIIDTPNICNIL